MFKSGQPIKQGKTDDFALFEVTEASMIADSERIWSKVVYRPGTMKPKNRHDHISGSILSLFWSEFDDYLAAIPVNYDKFIVCGDFTFYSQNNSNSDVSKFLAILKHHEFIPAANFQSQSTHCKGGVLDAFITRHNNRPHAQSFLKICKLLKKLAQIWITFWSHLLSMFHLSIPQ